MNGKLNFTLEEAIKLENCPNCNGKLKNENNKSELIFWTSIDRDSIIYYECPYCNKKFSRK